MKYRTLFHMLSCKLKEAGIPPVLIGGYAVNAHKVTRQTLDVDLLMTEDDYRRLLPPLRHAGCEEVLHGRLFARIRHPALSLMEVDMVFVDGKTRDGVVKEGKEVELEGEKFFVPSLNHLFALKLHAMKQNIRRRGFRDLQDILDLANANGVDIEKPEFRDLFLKYGPQEIYEEILGLVKKWKN